MGKIWGRINRAWRLVGTGLAFSFIFVGGGLFAMTVLRTLSFILGPSRERAQYCIHQAFRLYIFSLQTFGLIHFEFQGVEKLKDSGGKMIIANHPTLLDVVVLMSLIPRSQCIVKNALWNHPFLGALMHEAGYIRNDLPPEDIIAACQKSLAEGCCLIIFPEGTRSTPNRPFKFQRGFANIAILCRAKVIRAVIHCVPPTLVKGEPWWVIPPTKPEFKLIIEDTLDTQDYILYGHNSLNSRAFVKILQQFYHDKCAS